VRIRHRHSHYTGGQPPLCSRPSDGRTEFIGSVRRNQKPLRWTGLDLPPRPLDAFENRSPRNSLDILQKSKEILTIFHPLGSPPAHPKHSMHPICLHATRYSSTCPTYYKVFIHLAQTLEAIHLLAPKCYKLIIHLTQMLQAIHPLGSNVQSIPPLSSNVQGIHSIFGPKCYYKVRASFH
jgi:hypothetical protein